MKVILLENVRKIGSIGEIIDVKRGFARNFLISKKKALFASKENIKEVEKIKQELNKKDQDKKKELAPRIKHVLKKHGMKGTLSIDNYSSLRLTLQSGSIDFGTDSINEYWYKDHFADNPKALAFLSEVIPAMNVGNFDNSDPMTDYFHVGWYVDVNLGRWDKPYVYTGGK